MTGRGRASTSENEVPVDVMMKLLWNGDSSPGIPSLERGGLDLDCVPDFFSQIVVAKGAKMPG
jgi:hypothetical protein